MQQPKDEKIIHSSPTFSVAAAIAATLDAQSRSDAAAESNPDFFLSTAHQRKIEAVTGIVTAFLHENKGVYVNHRENRGRPFTVVKLNGVRWPGRKTRAQARNEFYDPLDRLGVKPVFSAQTSSYLFRIY